MTTRRLLVAATTGLLPGLLFATVAISSATHDAPVGGYVGDGTHAHDGKPVNVPTWRPAYADRFPGCVATLPAAAIPSGLVVVRQDATVARVSLDAAFARNDNSTPADDVFVVGSCQ